MKITVFKGTKSELLKKLIDVFIEEQAMPDCVIIGGCFKDFVKENFEEMRNKKSYEKILL